MNRRGTVRGEQEARLAAAPRCIHGRLLSGGAAYQHLECRECLPDGSSVDAWVADHPGGADMAQVAEALGVTRQAVQQTEARTMRRLRAALGLGNAAAGDGKGAPRGDRAQGGGSGGA